LRPKAMSKERKEEAIIIYPHTIRCIKCGYTSTFYSETPTPPEEIFCPLCKEMKIIKIKEES